MVRKVVASCGVVLALVALGGCGDDDDAGAAAPAADECADVTVDIGDFRFEPDPVQVDACDSVVWANTHDQAHTSTGNGDQSWTTGSLAPGAESEPVRFDDTGTFTYICALHPFMTGEVTVA
jgi:plastocyanin